MSRYRIVLSGDSKFNRIRAIIKRVEAAKYVGAGINIRSLYVVAQPRIIVEPGRRPLLLSVDDFETALFAFEIADDIVAFEQTLSHRPEHPIHE